MEKQTKEIKDNDLTVIKLDTTKEELIEELNKLTPISGICISIDICHSTEMKDAEKRGLTRNDWILMFQNSFNLVDHVAREDGEFIEWQFIKSIGDEFMYFCPFNSSNRELPTSITFTKLKKIIEISLIENPDEIEKIRKTRKDKYPQHKITVCYCKNEAYKMTFTRYFLEDYVIYPRDYYGLDIDKTFRIAGEAKKHVEENSIILDEGFFNLLKEEWMQSGGELMPDKEKGFMEYLKPVLFNNHGLNEFEWRVIGPCPIGIKDFPIQKTYYMTLKKKEQ